MTCPEVERNDDSVELDQSTESTAVDVAPYTRVDENVLNLGTDDNVEETGLRVSSSDAVVITSLELDDCPWSVLSDDCVSADKVSIESVVDGPIDGLPLEPVELATTSLCETTPLSLPDAGPDLYVDWEVLLGRILFKRGDVDCIKVSRESGTDDGLLLCAVDEYVCSKDWSELVPSEVRLPPETELAKYETPLLESSTWLDKFVVAVVADNIIPDVPVEEVPCVTETEVSIFDVWDILLYPVSTGTLQDELGEDELTWYGIVELCLLTGGMNLKVFLVVDLVLEVVVVGVVVVGISVVV